MGAGVRQQLRVKPRGAPGADIDRHRTHEEADPVHGGGAPSAGRRLEGGLRPKVHRVERAETSNELAGELNPVEGEERRLRGGPRERGGPERAGAERRIVLRRQVRRSSLAIRHLASI